MSGQDKKTKILVVDDDPGVLHLLSRSLETAHGYQVVTAQESRVGLHMAKEEKPDLIILDILIPDMSGGELAQKLKEDPVTKDIPIVFISIILEKGGKKKIEVNGEAYRAVAKPLYQPELLSAIRKTLNEYVNKSEEEEKE